MADYDAIIIGSGHNALVSAAYLARGGWRTLVLEGASEIGGGLRSGELTIPGFCHDRYASNVGQFAASPAYGQLKAEFDRLGVRFLRSDKSYASLYGRKAVRVYTDAERTLADLNTLGEGNAAGWQRLTAFYKRTAPGFLPLFSTEMPSADLARKVARIAKAGVGDALRLAWLTRQTSAAFASSYVPSPEARGLLEAWAYHLDFAPEVPGGALFSFVAAVSSHVHGMPLVEGGAGRITTALQTIIENAGGRILVNSEGVRIVVKGGRSVAVKTRGGEEISCSRAVIASVTPRNLFGKLVTADDVGSRFVARGQKFRYGPGTFVIHLALDRMPQWIAADDLSQFNYLHVNGSEAEITETYRQSLRNLLPSRPLLIVSHTTPIDPSRAPPGKHVMRIHVRTVPGQIEGDAAGQIKALNWQDAKHAFADRLISQVEEHAPDLRSCIIGSAVESPDEIERGNPNFVGGDCVSGSHHFSQNFVCRPFFGWSRYATPIGGLYMVGASTWPGGGITGGSGYLLARKLLTGVTQQS